MNTLLEVEPNEEVDISIDVPQTGEFVACTQCSNRSYMFFFFKDDLMPFCKHHGEKNADRLEELGGALVADYRDYLIEKRTQGEP